MSISGGNSNFTDNSVIDYSLTASQSITVSCGGSGTLTVQLSGTWNGQVIPEVSLDGINYYSGFIGIDLNSYNTTGGPLGSTLYNNNIIQYAVAGMATFRLRGDATMTGTAVVSIISSVGSNILTSIIGYVYIGNLPADPSTSALQTTGNASLASINGKLTLNYGVATAALRTASQIGNTTGQADFNAGTTGAQTLRVVLPTDQSAIPVNATLTAETTKVIGTVNQGTNPWIIAGNKTNNNAAPGATNVGTLPALANAAAPSWSEGNQVALSVDLAGNARTIDKVDSGRNQTNYFMAIQIINTATDALRSLTGYKSNAAVAATTTPAVVTAGKTYRITSITMSHTTIVTTPGSTRFTLRANTGGTVAITSPAVCNWEVGEPSGIAPVAGKKNTVHLAFPDGIEFAAGTGIGISMVGLNTVGAAAAVGYGQISITGFEY